MRIDRDEMFMRMAELAGMRGSCPRAHVGAVLVQDRRPISMGYNGAPPGMPHCDDAGCEMDVEHPQLGCQRTIHAEANAIAWAARAGLRTEGATLYTTYSPCRKCAELLAAAGIAQVMFARPYRATPWELVDEMGINLVKLQLHPEVRCEAL
jgi:dCMP deaminase